LKNLIKELLKPFIPLVVNNIRKRGLASKQMDDWQKRGCPVPPPHIVKQNIVQEYQQKYGYKVFVETGTNMGDMVEAQKSRFNKIISIELGFDLFQKAKKKFINDKNIHVLLGDSGNVLPKILKDIDEPAVFWLDGHYSGGITVKGDKECPILEELDAIFKSKKFNHVLLIDDARCFNGQNDYPTLKTLIEYIKRKDEKYQIEIKHDIIRCTI
jgi:hypothetical protein